MTGFDDGLRGGAGRLALLAAASLLAGAVNAVAGGGTILTFPVLAAILPPDPARPPGPRRPVRLVVRCR